MAAPFTPHVFKFTHKATHTPIVYSFSFLCSIPLQHSAMYLSILLLAGIWVISNLGSILICSGCHNKVPQTAWLQQLKFIFSQYWSMEVQDQDVSKFRSSCALSLGLHKAAFSWCPHVAFPLCVFICGVSSSSHTDKSYWIRASLFCSHFIVIICLKVKHSHIRGSGFNI